MVGSLNIHVGIQLVGVGVVVFIVAVGQQLAADVGMGCVGDKAKMVAIEILHRQSADDVPPVVLVVGVPHQSVGVLRHSLLAHEVCPLDVVAVVVGHGQSELRKLVLRAELLVVAVAVGIVQRGRRGPVVTDVPRGRQDVVVLPEVVGRTVPVAAVGHLVALCGVGAVVVDDHLLVERVVAAQSLVVHVLIGMYARG